MQSYTLLPAPPITALKESFADLPHVLFEAWVDQFLGEIAIISGSDTFTYAQVEQRANQIAHGLRGAGVQRGDIVAVLLDRGPELVCALLGVLKAGAAFAALDPQSPQETRARTFSTIECACLLTCRSLAANLPATTARSFYLDDSTWLAEQPDERPVAVSVPDDPACVLFTSGSTGRPKAVLYSHRNLAARFANTGQLSDFVASGVFAQSSPITSIDAVDEIFIPLVHGGCTAILPYTTVTNPHQLVRALANYGVTHMLLVPSLLRVMLSAEQNLGQKLPALRIWMVGGEPLTAPLVRQFYQHFSAAVLINFYGLTEGDGTYHVTHPAHEYASCVPIGHPVADTKVYLLAENLSRVVDGEPGEICLAGEGLFHQYLNCPELNAERWVANPFDAEGSFARLFRTGDLGRRLADGAIEYVGRRDRMVKVRGFRVELGELEAALDHHPSVAQCAAVAKHPLAHAGAGLHHHTYVVMYAVLKGGAAASSESLREFLKDRLPDYAVPAMVFIRDSLPLCSNGKVDLQILSQFDPVEREACKAYVPARDAVELQLTQIWERLLNFSPIGVTDSFFEIGGDSLSAIDLMLTLEKEFHCQLPITTLIQSPTIATLAAVLRGDGKKVPLDSLVPIRPHGSRPPLFCIHADGSVFIYRRFVEYLDPEIPVYGLQAHGLANPKDQPYRQIDEMACHYVREVRTVQPHGPYHLCAFSAGGLIIFEMARQLEAAGETVAFLGMLDAYGPDYPEYLPSKNVVSYKLSVHLNTLRLHGMQGQFRYLGDRARHRANSILSKLFARLLLKLRLPLPPKVHYEYVARLIDRAARLYPRGRTHTGGAVLFRALTQPEGVKPDPTLGWSTLVNGELKILDVVGTHNSIMMHEPHVAELVRKIDRYLGDLQNCSRNPDI